MCVYVCMCIWGERRYCRTWYERQSVVSCWHSGRWFSFKMQNISLVQVVFHKSKIFILFVCLCVCVLCQNRSNVATENTKVPCGVCGGRPFFILCVFSIITYYIFAHQNISPIPCFSTFFLRMFFNSQIFKIVFEILLVRICIFFCISFLLLFTAERYFNWTELKYT